MQQVLKPYSPVERLIDSRPTMNPKPHIEFLLFYHALFRNIGLMSFNNLVISPAQQRNQLNPNQ